MNLSIPQDLSCPSTYREEKGRSIDLHQQFCFERQERERRGSYGSVKFARYLPIGDNKPALPVEAVAKRPIDAMGFEVLAI